MVLFLSDDHDIHYTSVYGNEVMRTPNMDRLAKEGMTFTRAYTATAMCAPSRSMLYTGLFPHRNGAVQNHSQVHADVKSIPHYLRRLGYRVVLAGKKHIGPKEAFPFEYIARDETDDFLRSVDDQPFCLIVATNDPHTPHASGEYEAEEVNIPPHLVDTPETRQRMADYSTDINQVDRKVGQVLGMLKNHGLEKNTLFIYTSDHGGPIPFSKWTLYEAGLRVPFIARWPSVVPAGRSTDAMISFVDLLPTFIEMAGGTPPETLDGKSFLEVLKGKTNTHHDVIYGTHTTKGIRNGQRYPIRSVRTDSLKYIVNLEPFETFTNNITEGAIYNGPSVKEFYASGENYGLLWKSWIKRAGKNLHAARRTLAYQHRPTEELYNLNADSYEQHNLAKKPGNRQVVQQLRKKLAAWMKEQGDPELQTFQALFK